MKVKELIAKLEEYNQEANIEVSAHNKGYAFTIAYGSNEGVTMKTADIVSIYVDELMYEEALSNQKEKS